MTAPPGSRPDLAWPIIDVVALLLACLAYMWRTPRRQWVNVLPIAILLGSLLCRIPQVLVQNEQTRVDFWRAEQALMLGGLAAFGMVLERRLHNLQLQVFLRMNVIAIVVATLLVLFFMQTERKQLLALEEMHVQDMAEFLRGQILEAYQEHKTADEVFSNPEIVRRVVADFGSLPDLRNVRILYRGRVMQMTIDENGTVDQNLRSVSDPSPVAKARERLATVVSMSVYSGRRFLGRVELDETTATIDAAIARQVRSIFWAFTALVAVSAILIAVTVSDANRTLVRQGEEIQRKTSELAQAGKLASVGQLAGGVAHEINNPAAIIIMRAQYLQAVAGHELSGDCEEGLKVIENQAQRISSIVKDLLTFSRPSPLEVRQVNISSLLGESVSLVAPRCRASQIDVKCELQKHVLGTQADPERLKQVFVNILNNAIDATPSGGRITATTGLDGHHVFARISDTGCGISQDHLARLFDPFFTTKAPGSGTGLGLSISYGLIRDHGGDIRVESAVGKGATFTVILPLRGGGDRVDGANPDRG